MNLKTTWRSFDTLIHPVHPTDKLAVSDCLIQISFLLDDEDKPLPPELWIGEHHRLSHREVGELVVYLVNWLATGRLTKNKTKSEAI